MIIYTKTPSSKKKKKNSKATTAKKLDKSSFVFRTKKPTEMKAYRVDSTTALNLPSKITTCGIASKPSIMDPVSLNKETAETRQQILSKAKRLAPLYSKGAVQYITDGEDVTTLGKKIG